MTLPEIPSLKYWTQSVGALKIICKNGKKILLTNKLYFQLAVQDICLARMLHCLEVVSPYVCVRVTESVALVPNSTYT